jgi:hypothetical protein
MSLRHGNLISRNLHSYYTSSQVSISVQTFIMKNSISCVPPLLLSMLRKNQKNIHRWILPFKLQLSFNRGSDNGLKVSMIWTNRSYLTQLRHEARIVAAVQFLLLICIWKYTSTTEGHIGSLKKAASLRVGMRMCGSTPDISKTFFSSLRHLDWLWGTPSLLMNGFFFGGGGFIPWG